MPSLTLTSASYTRSELETWVDLCDTFAWHTVNVNDDEPCSRAAAVMGGFTCCETVSSQSPSSSFPALSHPNAVALEAA